MSSTEASDACLTEGGDGNAQPDPGVKDSGDLKSLTSTTTDATTAVESSSVPSAGSLEEPQSQLPSLVASETVGSTAKEHDEKHVLNEDGSGENVASEMSAVAESGQEAEPSDATVLTPPTDKPEGDSRTKSCPTAESEVTDTMIPVLPTISSSQCSAKDDKQNDGEDHVDSKTNAPSISDKKSDSSDSSDALEQPIDNTDPTDNKNITLSIEQSKSTDANVLIPANNEESTNILQATPDSLTDLKAPSFVPCEGENNPENKNTVDPDISNSKNVEVIPIRPLEKTSSADSTNTLNEDIEMKNKSTELDSSGSQNSELILKWDDELDADEDKETSTNVPSATNIDETVKETGEDNIETALRSDKNKQSNITAMDTDINDTDNIIADLDKIIQGDDSYNTDNVKPTVKDSKIDEDRSGSRLDSNKENPSSDMDVDISYSELDPIKDNPSNSSKISEIEATEENLMTGTEYDVSEDKEIEHEDDVTELVGVKSHGLTKPNVMIEIPSQELIDIDDSLNLSFEDSAVHEENKTVECVNKEKDLINKIESPCNKEATEPDNIDIDIDNEFDEDNAKSGEGILEKLADILETTSEVASDVTDNITMSDKSKPIHSLFQVVPTTSVKKIGHDTADKSPCSAEIASEDSNKQIKHVDLKNASITATESSSDSTKVDLLSKEADTPSFAKDPTSETSKPEEEVKTSVSSKDPKLNIDSTKDLDLPSTSTNDLELPSTSVNDLELPSTSVNDLELPSTSVNDLELPSTSVNNLELPSTSAKNLEIASTSKEAYSSNDIEAFIKEVEPVKPVTFQMEPDPDSLNEVPVVTDSLGLLAESTSRAVDDDPDTPEEDDDDDDADPDYDESSNQAEQSEDQSEESNPPHLEGDLPDMVPSPSYVADDVTPSHSWKDSVVTDDASDYPEKETIDQTEKDVQIDGDEDNLMESNDAFNMEINMTSVSVADIADNEELEKDGDIELDINNELEAESLAEVTEEMDVQPIAMEITEVTSVTDTVTRTVTETVTVTRTVTETVTDTATPAATDVTVTDVENVAEQQLENEPPEAATTIVSPKPIEESVTEKNSLLKDLLEGEKRTEDASSPKLKTLAIAKPKHVVSIVDLEESSEDVVPTEVVDTTPSPAPTDEVTTSVNIPTGIEIMSSGEVISEITTKKGEIIISGVPKPPVHKMSRLNTDEITIKTGSTADSIVIPETKIGDTTVADSSATTKLSLEVFSLDSDEDDTCKDTTEKPTTKQSPVLSVSSSQPQPTQTPAQEKPRCQCVNRDCNTGSDVTFYPASQAVLAHFDSNKKRGMVCEYCFGEVVDRTESLIEDIKKFTPLLELNMKAMKPDLVEISDSDSDDEQESKDSGGDQIGAEAALKLEKELALMINATWDKYDLDSRLKDAETEIGCEIARIDKESAEIHHMLDTCQAATDKLRGELYATFEPRKEKVAAIAIYDTPDRQFMCDETAEGIPYEVQSVPQTRQSKRRLSSVTDLPSKRQAVPLSPATDNATEPVEDKDASQKLAPPASSDISKVDDDKEEVSVVRLCLETAPASLPPLGPLARPPLSPALPVFAMRNAFGSWIRARVMEVTPKGATPQASQFSMVRVKFESKNTKTPYKVVPARCIAYDEPATVRMTIGTRCIALFKDSANTNRRESYYSGVVAEVPNPVNNFRYLVFFDDGYAQYVHHQDTRLVAESSNLVWEEVHPFSREFVRQYLLAYPERPMVRLHTGQNIKTEWNGKWWITRVLAVDASLVQVHFSEDNRSEWIYRGSTRLAPLFLELQAAERTRARPMPRNRQARAVNMPYVEYTRSDEQEASKADAERARLQRERLEQDIRRQRAVAKKSTAPAPPPPASNQANLDTVTSRVVYYTPKNAVKPYKYSAHTCSPRCKRSDVLALSDLRTYNPLAKPLLSGWERQVVRLKGHKAVMYRAPCGRRLRDIRDLHRYLRVTESPMAVDLFDFSPATHCLAEFVLNKCIVGKKDLSHGKENVPVPCVNYYDDSLPEFCSYNTERTPTAGVPLNIDPDFLCGCDCTDDCQDKSKCACWQMTLEGARTIGMDPRTVGYEYKRLLEPLPSGIYECNSKCKCKHTCLNRVAQHPLQLKLQVFKTLNRGWGIRALNDVPKGAFLCVYAGNLLTDATANLDGLNEGDEYLAELDYIEVVEQMKEGYEEDIPEKDKKLDKKESGQESSEEEVSSSSDEDQPSKTEQADNDFQPGYIPQPKAGTFFSKRLRKRDKNKKEQDKKEDKENQKKEDRGDKDNEECITISDDEELREPSRFTAEAGITELTHVSKYRSVRSLFGKDEACYIMDAKVQGNIGRYLNHSCSPNVFVQNVFVDTHDPRFPWVAFFALSHIKAGTELTWNYNYDIGSVPGKTLYCYCSAPNCRGRLL